MNFKINLLEFIKYGKFSTLQLGESRDSFLDNFPSPDGFEDGDDWRDGNFEIFTYGDMEFHFFKDRLYLIFSDYFNILDGGDSLAFEDRWIFEKESKMLTIEYVVLKLVNEKIAFSIEWNEKSLGTVVLKIQSGVELLFEKENHNDNFSLMAISLVEKGASS